MRYPALRSEHALQTLQALRRGDPVDERRCVELRGSGDDIERRLGDLERELYAIRSRFRAQLQHRDPQGGEFEAEACGVVHRTLPLDPYMLADHEWWIWLAVFRFRDLVEWRHGHGGAGAALANFGIGSLSENLFYRMWLRADIAYDRDRQDPYELAARGDQDFWRSHLFRQGYGRCRALAKALILYQFPNDLAGKPRLKIDVMRQLAKRLRRLQPNVMLEFLSLEEAYHLVEREAEQAILDIERLHIQP